MDNGIPLKECEHASVYVIKSRNLSYGVFNQHTNGFIGIREKFNDRYLFTEFHYEDGAPFGTVTPLGKIEKLPSAIQIRERVGPICSKCKRGIYHGPKTNQDRDSTKFHIDDDSAIEEEAFSWVKTYVPLFDYLDRLQQGHDYHFDCFKATNDDKHLRDLLHRKRFKQEHEWREANPVTNRAYADEVRELSAKLHTTYGPHMDPDTRKSLWGKKVLKQQKKGHQQLRNKYYGDTIYDPHWIDSLALEDLKKETHYGG